MTLNTTLREQVFQIPQSFLALLPADAPTTVTVYAAAPENRRQRARERGAGVLRLANIQGSIILFDTVTLTGFLSFTAATDIHGNGFVRIAGAVSMKIDILGSLSGSLDLQFYTQPRHRRRRRRRRPGESSAASSWCAPPGTFSASRSAASSCSR